MNSPKKYHVRLWQAACLSLATLLVGTLVFGARVLLPRYDRLHESVDHLDSEVTSLRQEQNVPADILRRYHRSICYIYASYTIDRPRNAAGPQRLRLTASGSGFVISNGVIATNKHVVQPVFQNAQALAYVKAGAKPVPEKLVAFFPDQTEPVTLHGIQMSSEQDLALAKFETLSGSTPIEALPLAAQAATSGSSIVVVGYPLGASGMVAKSPEPVYERLAFSSDTIGVVEELAARSLIRPSATYGHLGDVVGQKLIYDAPTAHGGSGGPVVNTRGEVIAVNSAYMNGFAGGTIGLSVDGLKTLLHQVQKQ